MYFLYMNNHQLIIFSVQLVLTTITADFDWTVQTADLVVVPSWAGPPGQLMQDA